MGRNGFGEDKGVGEDKDFFDVFRPSKLDVWEITAQESFCNNPEMLVYRLNDYYLHKQEYVAKRHAKRETDEYIISKGRGGVVEEWGKIGAEISTGLVSPVIIGVALILMFSKSQKLKAISCVLMVLITIMLFILSNVEDDAMILAHVIFLPIKILVVYGVIYLALNIQHILRKIIDEMCSLLGFIREQLKKTIISKINISLLITIISGYMIIKLFSYSWKVVAKAFD